MKSFRKIIAVTLAILTMLSVSIPVSAAKSPCNAHPSESCPQSELIERLCKNGQYNWLCRLILYKGKSCQPNSCPVQQPTSPDATEPTAEQPTIPAPKPTEPAKPEPTAPIAEPTTHVQQDNTLSAYEREVVALTNRYRAQYGLSPLTIDTHLSEIARMKSLDMHDKRYFDHNSPTYGSPFDMMKRFGVTYRTAGENIAMGYRTAQSVVDGWMNSPGHRANILNKSFTKIGVGYVADGSYCTQMFIG